MSALMGLLGGLGEGMAEIGSSNLSAIRQMRLEEARAARQEADWDRRYNLQREDQKSDLAEEREYSKGLMSEERERTRAEMTDPKSVYSLKRKHAKEDRPLKSSTMKLDPMFKARLDTYTEQEKSLRDSGQTEKADAMALRISGLLGDTSPQAPMNSGPGKVKVKNAKTGKDEYVTMEQYEAIKAAKSKEKKDQVKNTSKKKMGKETMQNIAKIMTQQKDRMTSSLAKGYMRRLENNASDYKDTHQYKVMMSNLKAIAEK